MTNLYHVFHKMPALDKMDMFVELEELAEKFVHSGLLRIDAEPKQNFARFSIPSRNIHINFSKREIYENHLLPKTKNAIAKALKEAGAAVNLDKKIDNELDKLKDQLTKYVEVDPELEMQVARVLVQSAHPVVFLMIMLEQVEVFVSFGHNIGEVMDVASWRSAGSNSGMQSTDGKNVAIFVSCGGDPFYHEPPEVKEQKAKNQDQDQQEETEKTYGDGLPALGRMMAIAGQEIGHYSDIIHNKYGQQIGRISANFSGTKADVNVNIARITDQKNIYSYYKILGNIGFNRLLEKEKEIQFYNRNPVKTIGFFFKLMIYKIYRHIFMYRAKKLNFYPIIKLADSQYITLSYNALSADMLFNLEPKADVYSHSDKNVEVAIACIEALARVPQQANKWGHYNTSFFWRNLYKVYYNRLIPSLIRDYENMSGQHFTLYPNKMRKYSWQEKMHFRVEEIKLKIKRFFKK
jgi:hypothetical protein